MHADQADNAFLVETLVLTLMVVLHENAETAPTSVTVKEVFAATHSANATLVAMEDLFLLPLAVVE